MPTIRCLAPEAIAASSSSPVPRVVAASGLRFSSGTSTSPDAAAISITAVCAVAQQAESGGHWFTEWPADRGLANGAAGRGDQGIDRSFAAVGHRHAIDRRAGQALATPRDIARAASAAVRLPLNLSGAITTRIVAEPGSGSPPSRRRPVQTTSSRLLGRWHSSIIDRPGSVQVRHLGAAGSAIRNSASVQAASVLIA